MQFGIHIKSIYKKTHSNHHYPAIQKRALPVWQGVFQKPWHGNEKHRGKPDPQQTKNKNNQNFIVHVATPKQGGFCITPLTPLDRGD